MPHRRTSGAKVRTHKLGVSNARYHNGKQARLQGRRLLHGYLKTPEQL